MPVLIGSTGSWSDLRGEAVFCSLVLACAAVTCAESAVIEKNRATATETVFLVNVMRNSPEISERSIIVIKAVRANCKDKVGLTELSIFDWKCPFKTEWRNG